MRWSDLTQSEEYLALDDSNKEKVRDGYFNDFIAPNVSEAEKDEAYNYFVEQTGGEIQTSNKMMDRTTHLASSLTKAIGGTLEGAGELGRSLFGGRYINPDETALILEHANNVGFDKVDDPGETIDWPLLSFIGQGITGKDVSFGQALSDPKEGIEIIKPYIDILRKSGSPVNEQTLKEVINIHNQRVSEGDSSFIGDAVGGAVQAPFDWAADKLQKGGDKLEEGLSYKYQKDRENSQITGDLSNPETWDGGKDPSISGYISNGIDVFGSLAPAAITAYLTRGKSLGTQMAAGSAVGGMQAGGMASQSVEEEIGALDHNQLLEQSRYYKELIGQGFAPEKAKEHLTSVVKSEAFKNTGTVGAAGGLVTGYIFSPLTRLTPGSTWANVGSKATIEGVKGGLEETAEGVAEKSAYNKAGGFDKDVMEDSFGNFAMGVIGEAPAGGIAGFTSRKQAEEDISVQQKESDQIVENLKQKYQPLPQIGTDVKPQADFTVDAEGNVKSKDYAPEALTNDGVIYAGNDAPVKAKPEKDARFDSFSEEYEKGLEETFNFRKNNELKNLWGKRKQEYKQKVQSAIDGLFKESKKILESEYQNDVKNTNVLDIIREYGGINRQEAIDNGIDPETVKSLNRQTFRSAFTKDGMSFDDLAELFNDNGIDTPYSENRKIDAVRVADYITEVAEGKQDGNYHIEGSYFESDERVPDFEQIKEALSDKYKHLTSKEIIDAVNAENPKPRQKGIVDGIKSMIAENSEDFFKDMRDNFDSDLINEFNQQTNTKEVDTKELAEINQVIDAQAQETNTEPSQAQIEAGNYKKGKVKIHGLDIAIENPKGSTRSGTDPNGKDWSVTMNHHYGDIKRTEGADGDNVDVFIGDNPTSENVYIIDQVDAKGNFDEHKVMLGFANQTQAVLGYKSNYSKGWKVGPVKAMKIDQFKDWLKNGDTKKEAAKQDQLIDSKESNVASGTGKKINKQDYYNAVSSGILKDIVSKSVQKDGQKLLDAIDSENIAVIDSLIQKYHKDAGRDQGGVGAGPKKTKQARRGAAQLWGLAVKAKADIEPVIKGKPKKEEAKIDPRLKPQTDLFSEQDNNDDPLSHLPPFNPTHELQDGTPVMKLNEREYVDDLGIYHGIGKLKQEPKKEIDPRLKPKKEVEAATQESINDNSPTGEIYIEEYSAKSFIIKGNTFEHKDQIKSASDKKPFWSRHAQGWILPNSVIEQVRESLGDLLGDVADIKQLTEEQKKEREEARAKATEERKAEIEKAKHEKSVKKLREVADNLEEKATESLNQDRNTHTHRMASMAANAESNARHDLYIAETMKKIADAIESGEAKFLAGVYAKTHVDLLNKYLDRAKYDHHKKIYSSYAEQERHKYDPVSPEAVELVEYPQIKIQSSTLREFGNDAEKYKGGKKIGSQLQYRARLAGEEYFVFRTDEDIELAKKFINLLKNNRDNYTGWQIRDRLKEQNQLARIGINNTKELKAALLEFIGLSGKKKQADPIKELERELVGNKIPGFFPTPKPVVSRMLDEADIQQGMKVLEPSAGKGNIADAVKELEPDSDITVIEINSTLQKLLKAKGYEIADTDFLQHQGEYDRIVMNPPFENGQDIDHLQHAYSLLNPGGRVVSIVSEGAFFRSDKKATEFREWLEENSATDEKLESGTFMDKTEIKTTGVASRIVVVDKPAESANESNVAKKTTEETKKSVPLANTDDVGGEMAYNRRQSGIGIDDVKNAENDTQKLELAQKKNIWKRPDYQEMVDGGIQAPVAHSIKQMYDKVPNKPSRKDDKYIFAYVETVEQTRKAVDDFLSDRNAQLAVVEAMAEKAAKRLQKQRSGRFDMMDFMSSRGQKGEIPAEYILDKVFPKSESGSRWGYDNEEGKIKAHATGDLYRNLEFSIDGFIKALMAAEEGWPAKQEAWQRSYKIKEDPKANKWDLIRKKYRRVVEKYDTKEDAIEAARELTKRIKEEQFKEPEVPIEKSVRKGIDVREGKNVSTKDLQETVGFKAINFGNWLKGDARAKERQAHVNSIFDAAHDLAGLLDVPVDAISLNGMLGVAVGAQGRGSYAAHFVPGLNEINITRGAGAGSFAHEWAHALDHYFAVKSGLSKEGEPFLSYYAKREYRMKDPETRTEIIEHFKTIQDVMTKIEKEYTKEEIEAFRKNSLERNNKNLERWLKQVDLKDANPRYKDLLKKIRSGDIGDHVKIGKSSQYAGKNINNLREEYKKITGRYFSLDRAAMISLYAKSIGDAADSKVYFENHPKTHNQRTEYFKNAIEHESKSYHRGQGKQYWSTDWEMFARGFEMYVLDKLALQDQRNDYLTSQWKAETEGFLGEEANARYPRGIDRERINNAFDALIDEIKHRQNDGRTELYKLKDKPTSKTLSESQVESFTSLVKGVFETAPIEVVASEKELPGKIASRIEKDGNTGNVKGFFANGKIYIVANAHSTIADMTKTLLHETVGHYGLRELLGDSHSDFINDVWRSMKPKDKMAIARRHNLKMGDKAGIAEEYIAEIAEKNIEPNILQKAIAKIKEIIKKLFDLKLSDNDIKVMLAKAKKYLTERKKGETESKSYYYNLKDDGRAEKVWKDVVRDEDGPHYQAEDYYIEPLAKLDTDSDLSDKEYRLDLGHAHFVGEGIEAWAFRVNDKNGKVIATLRAQVNPKNNEIVGVHDIEIVDKKKGLGEKIIAQILANADSSVKILEMVDKSWGFWQKMGVESRDYRYNDGTLTWGQYARQKRLRENEGREQESDQGAGQNKATIKDSFEDAETFEINEEQTEGVEDDWFYSIKRSEISPDSKWYDSILRRFQDKYINLKRTQQSIEQSNVIPDEYNTYEKETLMHGKAELALEQFEEGQVKPLFAFLASKDISPEELDLYLYAKHAPERNQALKERYDNGMGDMFEIPDGYDMDSLSGMKDSEAKEIVKKVKTESKLEEYEEAASQVYDMLAHKRDLLKSHGLLTDEEYLAWENDFDFYVPLKGFASNEAEESKGFFDKLFGGKVKNRKIIGKGFAIKGRESLRMLGRRTTAGSILSHSVTDVAAAILRSKKNEVAQSFLGMVKDNPDLKYWSVHSESSPATRQSYKSLDTVKMTALEMANSDEFVPVKKAGEQYFIRVNDPELVEAMKNMGVEEVHSVIKAMSAINRYLSTINTSLSPDFVVSNFFRDLQTGLFNAMGEATRRDGKLKKHIKGKEFGLKKLVGSYRHAFGAIWRGQRGKSAKNDWDKVYDEYLKAGAKTAFFDSKTVEEQAKDFKRIIEIEKGSTKGKIVKYTKAVLDLVEDINLTVENATRLVAYKFARDIGLSKQKAAVFAKDLTVNFNRRGNSSTGLNATYVFANASIQGTANFIRSMGQNPVRKNPFTGKREYSLTGAQAMGLAMVAAGFVGSMVARSLGGEADDGEDWIDKVPDYITERNMVFFAPDEMFDEKFIKDNPGWFGHAGEKVYFKIPLPYGYNIFHNVGSGLEQVQHGSDRKSKSWFAKYLTFSTLGSFSPIGSDESDDFDTGVYKTIVPTAAKPFFDMQVNENYFGSPIYKDRRFISDEIPDSATPKDSTWEGWKYIAKNLNAITGGDEYEKGFIDVAPESFDYVFKYATGGLGNFIDNMHKTSKQMQEGETDIRNVPILRKVVGKIGKYQAINDFYDRADEFDVLMDKFESMDYKTRSQFVKENRDRLKLADQANEYKKFLSEINKEIKALKAIEKPTKAQEEKIEKLENKKMEVVIEFNKAYNDL